MGVEIAISRPAVILSFPSTASSRSERRRERPRGPPGRTKSADAPRKSADEQRHEFSWQVDTRGARSPTRFGTGSAEAERQRRCGGAPDGCGRGARSAVDGEQLAKAAARARVARGRARGRLRRRAPRHRCGCSDAVCCISADAPRKSADEQRTRFASGHPWRACAHEDRMSRHAQVAVRQRGADPRTG